MTTNKRPLVWRFGASLLRIAIVLVLAVIILRQFFLPVRAGSDVVVAALTGDRLDGIRKEMPLQQRLMMNWYLGKIQKESGIDMQIVFTDLHGEEALDEYAARIASKRDVGRRYGHRGVLIVYDRSSQQARIELGYGLEPYFSDAFIGRLVEGHARVFFASGDVSVGVRTLARIIHERIRDEQMGGTFDPGPLELRAKSRFVSGGAGASGEAGVGAEGLAAFTTMDGSAVQTYEAQPTPARTYERYIEWMRDSDRSAAVGLFTEESRWYLDATPITEPYMDHILEAVWNESYEVIERGDVAMLYYTNTPLRSPMFFRRSRSGWQIDIIAEVDGTREVGGHSRTWTLIPTDMTRRFQDLYVNIDKFTRVRGGDNRPLPNRRT